MSERQDVPNIPEISPEIPANIREVLQAIVDTLDVREGRTKLQEKRFVRVEDLQSLLTALYQDAEIPAGAINGVNTTFTLKERPFPVESCFGLVRQGGAGAFLPVVYGTDFTLVDKTITMTMAPDASSNLVFKYRKA